MRTLDLFRPSVGAFAIGMARAALDLAIDYTSTRTTFGRRLREHQAIAHRLAELRARTEAARLLVHQAALAHDRGVPDPGVAAMSKLLATEVAQQVVDAAVQFHGAVALQRGHPLEHLYRDVRAPRIYEGASEIQREIIARRMYAELERARMTRTVVVTGAAGGIGTALVNRFAAAGDRVVALGRNADSLARLPQAEPVVCDVTDERVGERRLRRHRRGRSAGQQRRHRRVRAAAQDHAGGMDASSRGQRDRPVSVHARGRAGDARARRRRDRHGGLDRRARSGPRTRRPTRPPSTP